MDLALAGALAALALIDSTSFGTLLIPIWLLLAPGRVRAGRMLVYLGTIVVFYFAIGLAIALGAAAFMADINAILDTTEVQWVQLVLGVGLVIVSFRFDSKRRKEGGGRVLKWRERALGTDADIDTGTGASGGAPARTRNGSTASLMGLALAAAAVEVATMLPYLAAIGLITTAGMGTVGVTLSMFGYCLVMVGPALALMAARLLAHDRVESVLTRVNAWMTKHAASTTGWIIGIVGFLIARDAAVKLGVLEFTLGIRI